MKYKIFTDGGSRGNPGEAAIGVVIYNQENGMKLAEISKCIGLATNNIAEYSAVLEALNWVLAEKVTNPEIEFYLDSELVVKQLTGVYRVKDPKLKVIYFKVRQIVFELGNLSSFTAVRREKNREADALVNKALDGLTKN
jgi:ribonuclease HI